MAKKDSKENDNSSVDNVSPISDSLNHENKNSEPIETILIAEDSPPNRKILSHLLQKLGYRVLSCEDGLVAKERLESDDGEKIVAILSDIMMPNMNGLDLLKFVRGSEKYANIPFVLITAVSDKEYIVEAKSLNVNGYILKPVTFQRVTSKLEDLFPTKKFPKIAS